jgi:N6-L-threonylcarbamoyladenine synthase
MSTLTLGIESSCDETSLALVHKRKVLSCVTASSIAFHKRFGGVVPEIASRKQLEVIGFLLDEALTCARVKARDIKLIAVTQAPGLIGSLLVGVSFANALSYALKVPLVGVNHLKAHLFAPFLDTDIPLRFPFVGLIVSGGHTSLLYSKGFRDFIPLGATRDDAAGEAFDKIAKILGLGFPGGPRIERAARAGTRTQNFSMARKDIGLDFSFSGIKTAALYYRDDLKKKKAFSRKAVADIACTVQGLIVEDIVHKAVAACTRTHAAAIVAGGGVMANAHMRARLVEEADKNGIKVFLPQGSFATDNAAMVAGLGEFEVQYTKPRMSASVEPYTHAQW